MLVAAIALSVMGIVMLARPFVVWQVTEQWKSRGAEEPSDLYRLSIRFGGALCVLAGMAGLVASLIG